jgi:TusA-related sulfurtransferase
MLSITELNLIGVASPVCLLKCKQVLAEMNAGDMIEILLQDPDVVEALVKIIRRSPDEVIKSEPEGDHYRVHLKKGGEFNGRL